jgi:hypothetical protein
MSRRGPIRTLKISTVKTVYDGKTITAGNFPGLNYRAALLVRARRNSPWIML